MDEKEYVMKNEMIDNSFNTPKPFVKIIKILVAILLVIGAIYLISILIAMF
ncbi:hypothetical protein OKW22_000490 [Bacilli bacterium PM5-3]|nr:hypothetical protein [Bacilli bacterium PM5-3]MDH6604309.1 hypothetical protein [Bacilli bacterium PM5-9]